MDRYVALNKLRRLFGIKKAWQPLLRYRATHHIHSFLLSNDIKDPDEIKKGTRSFLKWLMFNKDSYNYFLRLLYLNDKMDFVRYLKIEDEFYNATEPLKGLLEQYKSYGEELKHIKLRKSLDFSKSYFLISEKYHELYETIKWYIQ